MTLTAPAILTGVAAALIALIGFELRAGPSTELPPNAAPRQIAPVTAADPRTVMPGQSDGWIKAVLARPLFSSSRRPEAEPAVAGTGPAVGPGLPRLAGIVVSSTGKNAIFAAPKDGKPIVARVGDRVGSFTVIEIAAGEVAVLGPGGRQLLHPTFDANAKAANGSVASSGPPAPQPGNLVDALQAGTPPAVSLPPAPSVQQMIARRRQETQKGDRAARP